MVEETYLDFRPLKKSKRSRFRAGLNKAKKMRKAWQQQMEFLLQTEDDRKDFFNPRRLGKWRKTRRSCSCWMCGNPRKFFHRRTIQETKDQLLVQEEMSDI